MPSLVCHGEGGGEGGEREGGRRRDGEGGSGGRRSVLQQSLRLASPRSPLSNTIKDTTCSTIMSNPSLHIQAKGYS